MLDLPDSIEYKCPQLKYKNQNIQRIGQKFKLKWPIKKKKKNTNNNIIFINVLNKNEYMYVYMRLINLEIIEYIFLHIFSLRLGEVYSFVLQLL